ncbi:MAG: hypothetical protein IPJ13_31525 [Saprospiraceae bacterium]|nr:hypothetical protein [Saprospiraceae bacterium]MBP6448062.1 hypothetical protein [Saprospiraceae bacterium]
MLKRNLMALIAAFFILIHPNLNAQDTENVTVNSDTTKTLFSNLKFNTLGLYIAPEVQFSQLAGEFTGMRGGSLMAIINKKFAFGATVTTNQRNFTPIDFNVNQALRLQYRSVGARAEYTFAPHKLVHISIPLTLGYGHASVDSTNAFIHLYDRDKVDFNGHSVFVGFGSKSIGYRMHRFNTTRFAFVQPAIHLDLNIFRYGKLFVGAGYRINIYHADSNTSLVNLTNAHLSGLTIQTGVKLGIFGVNIRKKQEGE